MAIPAKAGVCQRLCPLAPETHPSSTQRQPKRKGKPPDNSKSYQGDKSFRRAQKAGALPLSYRVKLWACRKGYLAEIIPAGSRMTNDKWPMTNDGTRHG
jgi:hypothetical protein